MTDENVDLNPLVKKIAKAFALDDKKDGVLTMAPEAANAFMLELTGLKQADREEVTLDIVALATRFKGEGGKSVEGAIGLLIAFAVAAHGDAKKVGDAFASAGMAKQAASVIGNDGSMKAPTADPSKPAAGPAVRAKRGLSK